MIVFFFHICLFLGELGFFLFILLSFFFFLKKIFVGGIFRGLFNGDFLRVCIVFLTVLVFFLMVLSRSFDFFKQNSWFSFLVVLIYFFIFLLAVFLCGRFIVFYLTFEMVVIPIFVIIIGWGYRVNRLQSAIYIFLYTFFRSLPFLIFLIYIFLGGYSFIFFNVFYFFFEGLLGSFFWALFCLVFIVKLPVFFFHLWLPKAHVEAPLLGSIVLAGILLKLGGYGFYKILTFSFKDFISLSPFLASFSLLGGCITGLLCIRQVDLKRLVAYSSVVHMAPVLAVVFFIEYCGVLGGLMIMLSHGLCSSCLFFILNLSYIKLRSRSYLLNRGGLFFLPYLSFFWFFLCISNIGFPPTFNFFSELFIIIRVFSYSYFMGFFIFFIMLLAGFYSVILYLFFNHGEKKFFLSVSILTMKDIMVVFLCLFYLFLFIFY